MKRRTVTAAAMCVVAALGITHAQARADQTGRPAGGTGETGTRPQPPKTGQATGAQSQPTKRDQAFVREAAMSGLAEVELGRLATQKASNADVKQFGQRMVDDHSKANDELKALASQKGIELPAALGPKHSAVRDKLGNMSGDAFDRAYMAQMVQDHNTAVAQFQRASKTARDSEVRAWAETHLPHLREHQKLAREVRAKVGGGKSGAAKQ